MTDDEILELRDWLDNAPVPTTDRMIWYEGVWYSSSTDDTSQCVGSQDR